VEEEEGPCAPPGSFFNNFTQSCVKTNGSGGGNGTGSGVGGRLGHSPATAHGGIVSPSRVSIPTFVCPVFADGKKGILWMVALTGEVVCLPRGTNGRGFGLIRKNKPRAKAFISAADKARLTKVAGTIAKAKSFATMAGFSCKKKAGQVTAPPKKKA